MIALPPLLDGAVQLTIAEPSAGAALTFAGADGTVTATIEFDGAEAVPGPLELVATTVNVYVVPPVSPDTTALKVVPFTVVVSPPGDDVTVYEVMGL